MESNRQQMMCQIHGIKKDHIFCIDDDCVGGFDCIECVVEDNKHKGCKYVIVSEFINDAKSELQKVFKISGFHQRVQEYIKFKDSIKEFDSYFQSYLDKFVEDLKTLVYKMINDFIILARRWKKQQDEWLESNSTMDFKDIQNKMQHLLEIGPTQYQQQIMKQLINEHDYQKKMDTVKKQFDQVQSRHQQIVSKTSQFIEQKCDFQKKMMREYVSNIEEVKQLHCRNTVRVDDFFNIDGWSRPRREINGYEQNEQEYQITISFSRSKLDDKMKVLDIIDQFNANHKVGIIWITFNKNSEFSQELIQMMIDRYHNLHAIIIVDKSGYLDEEMHYKMQELVRRSTLLAFQLHFGASLSNNDDAFKILKGYNNFIQQKQHLKELIYIHSRIDKQVVLQQKIEEIIGHVERQFDEIMDRDRKIFDGRLQLIGQNYGQQNRMMKKYVGEVQQVDQSELHENRVDVGDIYRLDENRQQIEEYKQNGQQYEIMINLFQCDTSLDDKMKTLDMINGLNANHKVKQIWIRLSNGNEFSQELMQMMRNRCKNVTTIIIADNNGCTDEQTHYGIQQLVNESKLVAFGLWFVEGLYDKDDDAFRIIKGYNDLIQEKQGLERLTYYHSGVKGIAVSQQKIRKLIDDVNTNANIEVAMKLKGSRCKVKVGDINRIGQHRREIQKYEYGQDQEYQIMINLFQHDTSLDDKMKILDMIDQLDVNHKVGIIVIKLNRFNGFSQELMQMMGNRYHNVHTIMVVDKNGYVDEQTHHGIQQLVKQSPLVVFGLWFVESLHDKDDAFRIIKGYNDFIQAKQHLQELIYKHSRIKGETKSQQGIKKLIDEVNTNAKIKVAIQLKQSQNLVQTGSTDSLDENRQQIEEYEQNEQEYEIQIRLVGGISVNDKMKTLDMIDQFDANHKVGRVCIELNDNNEFTQQLMQVMIDRYHNVHTIMVVDENEYLDEEMHYQIQELVGRSTLLAFTLEFGKSLFNNDGAFKMVKQYNQLIQYKQHLKELVYEHNRIRRVARSQQAVGRLIDDVNTNGNIEVVIKLKGCRNKIVVGNISKLNQHRREINEYKYRQDQEYQIIINFSDSKLDDKMAVLDMIDQLDVNHKVGYIWIQLGNNNEFSQQLVQVMIDRYHNLYDIVISDKNEYLDEEMHYKIQELVRKSILLEFKLYFSKSLFNNDGAFKMVKEYNQLIQYKQYLKQLMYRHAKIKGSATSQGQVGGVINEVNRIE